jgi:hypothetical protein
MLADLDLVEYKGQAVVFLIIISSFENLSISDWNSLIRETLKTGDEVLSLKNISAVSQYTEQIIGWKGWR